MPEPTYDDTIPFSGLTRYQDGELPDEDILSHGSAVKWWAVEQADKHDSGDVSAEDLPDEGLSTVINELPRASTAGVAWEHPLTGEELDTLKHNAIVNPERVENIDTLNGQPIQNEEHLETIENAFQQGQYGREQLEDELGIDLETGISPSEQSIPREEITTADDALYHIPTDTYTVYNPDQFLRPLTELIQEEELSDGVFGEFRVTRDGGRVSGDILFNGVHVDHPDLDPDRKPIVMGFQVDWDYFGDTALRAKGMSMDMACINAMRGITDSLTVKHTGDPENRTFKVGDREADTFYEVWDILFEMIELKADQLSQIIADAMDNSFDFSELPDDFAQDYDSIWEAFYVYAGFPYTAQGGELAKYAAKRLSSRAENPYNPTWWDIHRAATYAISHHAKGEVGKQRGAVDRYNRIANDMLMNPAVIEDDIHNGYADEKEEETLSEEGGGIAEISHAFQPVREAKDKFEERREQIEQLAVAGTGETEEVSTDDNNDDSGEINTLGDLLR